MSQIIITGASDDLIEIDGDLSEEFNWYVTEDDDRRFLAVSDGTLLAVQYDGDGLWRFVVLVTGAAQYQHEPGSVADDTNDVVTLTQDAPFAWVLFGADKAVRKGK